MKKLLFTLSLLVLLVGCATVYKSTVILTEIEDTAMKSWATAHNDGITTPELDRKVMDAHAKFNQAKQVALVAFRAGGDKELALQAARDAIAPLLELLAPLLSPEKLTLLKNQTALATQP